MQEMTITNKQITNFWRCALKGQNKDGYIPLNIMRKCMKNAKINLSSNYFDNYLHSTKKFLVPPSIPFWINK